MPNPTSLSPSEPDNHAHLQVATHAGIIRAELAKIFLLTACLSLMLLLNGCSVPTKIATEEPTVTFMPYSSSTPIPSMTVILPTITAAPTVGPSATPFVHIVEKDDTLLGIAIRYGVSLDDLLAANPGINPTILSVDQRIIIPGPEGDPDSTFLPEVTPVPLTLSEVQCFPTPTDHLWCITSLTNDEGYSMEGVSVLLSLLDEAGVEIDSEIAFSPLNLIPQGAVVPLSAYFPNPTTGYTFAVAVPISGFPATRIGDRYLILDLDIAVNEPSADRKSWRFGGSLQPNTEGEIEAYSIIILATAFDEGGSIVGVRKLQLNSELAAGEAIPFNFEVFSLGPIIDHAEILTEAMVSIEVE